MYLTISKRFEFSATRRYYREDLSTDENRMRFGRDCLSEHGVGQNYVAYFVFHGPVDRETGMLCPLPASGVQSAPKRC